MADIKEGIVAVDDFDADEYGTLFTGESELTSLSSSVYNYQYENGRWYHNFRAGKYLMPNDEIEQDRLDMTHHAWLLQLGGNLHRAPLNEPKKALDLGTGTGIWAVEFGDQYPECEVVGTDLSPIQASWVPPNVKFEIDDFEDKWVRDCDYDYIHGRNLIGSVKDWKSFIKTCYDHIAPGGYFELQESGFKVFSEDGTYDPVNSRMSKYIAALHKASDLAGRDMNVGPRLASLLKETGFEEVNERILKMPTGDWPKDPHYKELGKWGFQIGKTGAEAYGLAVFTRVLGISEKEAKELCEGTVMDSANRKIHMLSNWYVVYGRKPVDGYGVCGILA